MTTKSNSPYSDMFIEEEVKVEYLCAELGIDPELFDPKTKQDADEAKEVCRSCPRRVPCLKGAKASSESGVWGGTLLRDGRPHDAKFKFMRPMPSKIGALLEHRSKILGIQIGIRENNAIKPMRATKTEEYTNEEFDKIMGRSA